MGDFQPRRNIGQAKPLKLGGAIAERLAGMTVDQLKAPGPGLDDIDFVGALFDDAKQLAAQPLSSRIGCTQAFRVAIRAALPLGRSVYWHHHH